MATTWLVFLRAVNVGARKYPMAELRRTLADAGYGDVETYIQTGNIRLSAPQRSQARVEAALEEIFLADRGFEVPAIAMRPAELATIATDADEVCGTAPPEFGHYVELLRAEPDADARATIESAGGLDLPGQRAVVRGRAVHLLFDIPYHAAKAPNAAVKRALGVSTNRNVKVIRTLARTWTR